MRILVTNDDGIDSLGLHHLTAAMAELGEVVVVAPDREFSGASAAVGALYAFDPVVERCRVDGAADAWSLNGPPALCVLYARLGLFGDQFDLVVSGINPGANVGRSVYHSGTIGACLTARTGGISGVAVSQAVVGWGAEGQAWGDIIKLQKWHTAAAVAGAFVSALVADPPAKPVVANVNVPNLELGQIPGWTLASVGRQPPRSMANARLVAGDEPNRFGVDFSWGEPVLLPEHTDGGAIERDLVTVSYLTEIVNEERSDLSTPAAALDALLG